MSDNDMSDEEQMSAGDTNPEGGIGPQGVFDVDKIRQLTELMSEFDLHEVDLRQGRQRIPLRRGTAPAPTVVAAPVVPAVAPAVAAAPAARPEASGAAAAAAEAEEKNITYVKSPMVGTFYSKSNPDAPEFVKVGDRLAADTTVCIIEAMKVFNEIPADVSGRVVAVLVENEEAVDFGRPLFKIDTSG